MLIAYTRFSRRPNGESESCLVQLDRIRAWANSQGLEVNEHYSDENKSGKSTEGREGLEEALRATISERGTLCCYSLSRLARNTRDALEISARIRDCGANLVLLDLGLDTRGSFGKCMFTIMAALAELEREQISQRTSDALQRKARMNQRVSRFAPYGWKIGQGKTLLKDEFEQGVIEHILREKEKNFSGVIDYREMAQKLNGANIPCRKLRWSAQRVRKIVERNSK